MKITPYAASWNDEHAFAADTREDAINEALTDLVETIDRGDTDADYTFTVTIYTAPEWCVGSEGDEDCECGMGHEDYGWLMTGWGGREKHPVRVEINGDGAAAFDVAGASP